MEPEKGSAPYPEPPPPYSQTQPSYGPPANQQNYGGPPLNQHNYGGPPPPGMGYAAPNSQTVMMGAPQPGQGTVTVVSVAQWGPYPMQINCPHCGAQVLTETTASPGLLTWLLAGALVFFGCWLGCCLIPCCIPECQDIDHRCPNCKHHLGSFRRLSN